MSRRTVAVDDELCGGSGNCAVVAERVFAVDPDRGLADVLQPSPRAGDLDTAIAAAAQCPFGAITIDSGSA